MKRNIKKNIKCLEQYIAYYTKFITLNMEKYFLNIIFDDECNI